MSAALRVLLVEDSPTDAKLLLHALRGVGRPIEHERVEEAAAMRAALAREPWDVILSDWAMPRFSALGALEILKESGLDLPFLIVSGTIGEETAVDAMRSGAHDYLLKGNLVRLCPAIERELRDREAREARGRAEAALRVQEERYRRIVETTNEGVWLVDAEGRTTFVNARMARMLGCEVSEVVGRSPAEFLGDDGVPVLSSYLENAAAGISQQVEVRIQRRDGASLWALVEASPILDESGRYDGSLAMVIDVTARKEAEEAQRVSEARFARLWDSGIILITIFDKQGSIRDINEAGARMLGYSREEMLSGTFCWHDITPPEWSKADALAFDQLTKSGAAAAWEKELYRKDGKKLPILTSAALLGDAEGIAIAVDLSARKRAEEALRQSEDQFRQLQKMEAIGSLAGGVAHDFNNLLSIILSYSDLMIGDLGSMDPMRLDLEEIRKAGRRASELTRQLLLFSRQQVQAPAVIDLNEVLADVDKMLRRVVGEDVELASILRSKGRVLVDATHIEQVIMNLVANARDAMPTGGRLTVETGDVEIDAAYAAEHLGMKPGPYVMLAVSDTGVGMDRATQDRIFEPFFTTKEKGKGTGLGLSTVFGIVRQSGGSVWVYSEPGAGTTFKIYLPRTDAVADAARPPAAPTTLHGSETILLVEDDDQLRTVARDILKRYGYRVMEARNAGEALLLCEDHPAPIHLLLSDVVMPRMSGPELAKRLVRGRGEMRVLCMSGYTDDTVVQHGVLEPWIAFLQKPISPTMLLRKVREVLDAPVAPRPPSG